MMVNVAYLFDGAQLLIEPQEQPAGSGSSIISSSGRFWSIVPQQFAPARACTIARN